jgi:hypothetical protein
MFYKNDTRGQCYETVYICNVQIFVLSWSVCPWQAFPSQCNKHHILLPKLVNYGQIFFYKNDTRGQCYETFYVCNARNFVISWSVCPLQAFKPILSANEALSPTRWQYQSQL